VTIPDFSMIGTPAGPCAHCGKRRAVTTLLELRGFLHDQPSPLLAQVVDQVRRYYGQRVPIFICPGCGCITADSGNHQH
jgi:hypothetical protein